MTRRKAKDIALSILARWHLRTVGKQSIIKAATMVSYPFDTAELPQGRNAFLRMMRKPVRL